MLWLLGILIFSASLVSGLLVGVAPQYLFLLAILIAIIYCFFAYFEYSVLGLLILRSSLDIFSAQQIPAVFAVGVDALVITYVIVQLLTRKSVHTDKFFWFFCSWIVLQGFWVILLPLGGLGFDGSYLSAAIREWVRLFSWLMVYLLVMQLKDRIPPAKVISILFAGLVIPLTAGFMQSLLPESLLPSVLLPYGGSVGAPIESISRVNGTLGHPSTFVSFLVLFTGLTYWKIGQSQRVLLWCLLLVIEIFFLVSTKALLVFPMMAALILTLTLPRMDLKRLFGVIALFSILFLLFISSEFGRERLQTILETPLFNPDMTIDRAILVSWYDGNSFNWRLAQWYFLIEHWREFPILGYGLGLARFLEPFTIEAHNDYVRVLVENGLVGLFIFLIFYFFQFYYLLKSYIYSMNLAKKKFLLSLIAILFASLVGMLTDNILNHTTFFFYWWAIFSLIDWDWDRQQVVA